MPVKVGLEFGVIVGLNDVEVLQVHRPLCLANISSGQNRFDAGGSGPQPHPGFFCGLLLSCRPWRPAAGGESGEGCLPGADSCAFWAR